MGSLDPQHPPDGRWRIELLGWLRVRRGDSVCTRFQTRQTAALLAYLALHRRRQHPREYLAELLWPDGDPEKSRHRLSQALSSLRRQLESATSPPALLFAVDRAALRLLPGAFVTDVEAFEGALDAAAGEGRRSERCRLLRAAVDLYRGELLPGVYEEWCLSERERLASRYLQALRMLAADLEAGGELEAALEIARRAAAEDTLSEESHRELIRLLALTGQTAAAMRQFRELERVLREELGRVPDARTRQVVEQARAREGAPRPAPEPSRPGPLWPEPAGVLTLLAVDGSAASPGERERLGAALRSLLEGMGGREYGAAPELHAFAFASPRECLRGALAVRGVLEECGLAPRAVALETGDVSEAGAAAALAGRLTAVLRSAHPGQVFCLEAAAALASAAGLPPGVRLEPAGELVVGTAARPCRVVEVLPPGAAGRPLPALADAAAARLPLPLSRFFGREAELSKVAEALRPAGDAGAAGRLLTLSGTGGAGKTRLALETARAVAGAFPGGCWFAPLAEVRDGALLEDAVARAAGLPRRSGESLPAALARVTTGRPALLVLDNLEQVADQAALLARDLLTGAPELRILATSRRRLGLDGEVELPLPALPLPEPAADLDSVLASPSVRLLVDRARAGRPDFQVTPANCDAVVELCRRLEGIPLALELAAPRLQALTVPQLLARLDRRLDMLVRTGPAVEARHRTLRAALDWSCDLLPAHLRRLLARLSVFRGGWTLEAALAVAGAGSEVPELEILDGLEALRENSLILVDPAGAGSGLRFRMLETVREYALELLPAGESDRLSAAHAVYFRDLAERAEPHLGGPGQAAWLRTLDVELDNLRAAMEWGADRAEDPGECALRLAGSLWRYWSTTGSLTEGRSRAEAALRPGTTPPRWDSVRARALFAAGALSHNQGDMTSARQFHEEALAIRRELGDERGIASSLDNLGIAAQSQGEAERARALHLEAVEILRRVGDRRGLAGALSNLALVAHHRGEYAEACRTHEESLALRRELGDLRGVAISLHNLGSAAQDQGDMDRAREYFEESLALLRELGDLDTTTYSLLNLGTLHRVQGDLPAARRLLAEALRTRHQRGQALGVVFVLEAWSMLVEDEGDRAEAVRIRASADAARARMGTPLVPVDRAAQETSLGRLRKALGEAAYRAAWEAGRHWSLEEAVGRALGRAGPEGTAF